jgi:hypothetical protein
MQSPKFVWQIGMIYSTLGKEWIINHKKFATAYLNQDQSKRASSHQVIQVGQVENSLV